MAQSPCQEYCLIATTASIEKVLNLNHAPPKDADDHRDGALTNGLIPQATPILDSDGEPIWKVLVFDTLGRDVISSILRVNDLRSWGVTIHLYGDKIAVLMSPRLILGQEHKHNTASDPRCTCHISCGTIAREYQAHYIRP